MLGITHIRATTSALSLAVFNIILCARSWFTSTYGLDPLRLRQNAARKFFVTSGRWCVVDHDGNQEHTSARQLLRLMIGAFLEVTGTRATLDATNGWFLDYCDVRLLSKRSSGTPSGLGAQYRRTL